MLGSNSVSYYRRNGDGEHRAAAKWNSALHISETPNKRLVHSLWVCRLSSYSWKLCPNSLCVKHYRHRPVAKGGPKGAVPTRQIFVPPRRFWHCSTNSGLVKCSRMCICNLENYKHTICGSAVFADAVWYAVSEYQAVSTVSVWPPSLCVPL